jgi:hypothetical protein
MVGSSCWGWGMDVRSTSLHKEGKCDHIFFEELVPIMMIIRISLGGTSIGSNCMVINLIIKYDHQLKINMVANLTIMKTFQT